MPSCHHAIFSSKDKSKKNTVSSAAILPGALRVKFFFSLLQNSIIMVPLKFKYLNLMMNNSIYIKI